MILVFGGTTEGKKVAGILEKEEYHYFYSTKTKIDFLSGNYGTYRYGAFNNEALTNFVRVIALKLLFMQVIRLPKNCIKQFIMHPSN